MPASTAGLPDTCRLPHGAPPPPAPSSALVPSAAASGGGPKELRKMAQLRDVHVSVSLMEEFLSYARKNTSRGVETCGILAGRLLAGDSTFAITTLIIPKQSGTTDTVQALNEEEIFEAQFERELYPLGWIHTHPTQVPVRPRASVVSTAFVPACLFWNRTASHHSFLSRVLSP
jgi:hypothetical protein